MIKGMARKISSSVSGALWEGTSKLTDTGGGATDVVAIRSPLTLPPSFPLSPTYNTLPCRKHVASACLHGGGRRLRTVVLARVALRYSLPSSTLMSEMEERMCIVCLLRLRPPCALPKGE